MKEFFNYLGIVCFNFLSSVFSSEGLSFAQELMLLSLGLKRDDTQAVEHVKKILDKTKK